MDKTDKCKCSDPRCSLSSIESKNNYNLYLQKPNNNKLGICTLYGCGIDTNHDKAFKYFKKSLAIEKDNVEAKEWLVLCHLNGFGTPKSEKKAWKVLKGANSGPLFLKKGEFYLQGIPGILEPDHARAFICFNLAFNKGNCIEVYIFLGHMYEYGFGCVKDINEANKWYQKSADSGNAHGMYKVGMMYLLNNDSHNAFVEFTNSAERKNKESMNQLGHMYEHGIGCEKDINKAIEWYKKSADSGNARSMYKLGMIYILNNELPEAVLEFKKSAELKNKEATFHLGHMYEHGFGCEKNMNKAIEWYTKSADSGDANGMYKLALYYKKVEFNLGKVVYYLNLSADTGHKLAQFALGGMYENGFNSIKPDLVKSLKYYELSKKNGQEINTIELNEFIKEILHSFLTKLKNLVENYKNDRSLFDKSKKYKRYNYNIGVLYYKLNNLECACDYFEEVAYLNYQPAQKALGHFYKKQNNSELSSMWYNLSRGIINID
jgi:TPR repeat protein